MAYLLVRHTVKDYGTWKKAFDDHAGTRASAGSKGGSILRGSDDPNEIVALLEWDSVDNAKKFAGSAELKRVMENAGVVGAPDVRFLGGSESTAK